MRPKMKGSEAPVEVESVPQCRIPPVVDFTSQATADRLVTASDVAVALVVLRLVAKRFVLVAFVEVETLVKSDAIVEDAVA